MVDDSKLRLRARRNASISLEEGTLDPSRAVETPSSNLPMAKNNKSSADNLRALLGSPMFQDVSNGLGRIRGRVKRRRRRQVFYKACRLFIGGLAAAIVTAILSVGLLPFSWTQVDYHHQLQNEVQYVYQKIYDNRQNYHSVVDNYHPNGMSPMHNKHHHIHRGGPSDFQGPMDNEGDAESIQNNFGPSNSPKQNLRRKKSAYLELEDHDISEANEKDAPSKTIVENHTTSGAHEIFHCTDGTVGFKNDDYCDCVNDGLDEPDTSACSHILVTQRKFQCGRQENREDGEKIVWIFTSRVNDGIKDCPDGSDEYGWR